MVVPLAVITALGFVVAGFMLMLIEERSGNIKHLQLVCGLNKIVYWASTFAWDIIWYFAFVVLVIILFLVFEDPYFTGAVELPILVLLLVCYGLAATPWMYMWSFIFSSPATAYVFLFCLNFLAGFSFLLVDAIVAILEERGDSDLVHYTLVWVPFPSYALARSLMFLNLDRPLSQAKETLSHTSDPPINPYLTLLPFIASMLIQCCIYTTVIIGFETFPLIAHKL